MRTTLGNTRLALLLPLILSATSTIAATPIVGGIDETNPGVDMLGVDYVFRLSSR